VEERRSRGEKLGLVQIKMFRPFPAEEVKQLCRTAGRVGVLDRNYAAGSGGIFFQEVKASLQGAGNLLVQGYLTGVGGGDVIPAMVHEVAEDLAQRVAATEPVWMGIEP